MPVTHNIFTRYSYMIDGERKNKWCRVGYLKTTERGRQYLRLFHQPETTFYIMEEQERPEDLPVGQEG